MSCPLTDSTIAPGEAAPGVELDLDLLRHGAEAVLGPLRLTLPAGAITCLLGASGVGKSTVLRLIRGGAPPASQSTSDLCVRCDDGAPLAGRVAWMDQRDLLLPWLGVLDNILLGARLRGERPDAEAGRRLLAAVGMAGQATASPATLSTGMRQRVALARTLMERRPVVLMDEPFSALDVLARHRLQALAVRLLAGRTVLLVTHDPAEAVRVAHRVHVLDGRPARLEEVPSAPGLPPRDATAPACLPALRALQRRLGLRAADAAPGEDG